MLANKKKKVKKYTVTAVCAAAAVSAAVCFAVSHKKAASGVTAEQTEVTTEFVETAQTTEEETVPQDAVMNELTDDPEISAVRDSADYLKTHITATAFGKTATEGEDTAGMLLTGKSGISFPKVERDMVLDCKDTVNNLKPQTEGRLNVLWDFTDKMLSGIGMDGTQFFSEGCYGLQGYVDGSSIYYRVYNYSNEELAIEGAELFNDADKLEIPASGDWNIIDTTQLPEDIYAIAVKYGSGKVSNLFFLHSKGQLLLCKWAEMTPEEKNAMVERRNRIMQLCPDVMFNDVQAVLDTDELCYPVYPYNSSCKCETDDILELSGRLVEPDWSDERKIFAFHEYFTKNYAYDKYSAEKLGMSRAKHSGDYSGKYSPLWTHTGISADIADIFTAMCRAQGIPATTVRADGYEWNMVLVNDRWEELDLTLDIKRTVGDEAMNVENVDSKYCYEGYFTPLLKNVSADKIKAVNDSVYTAAFVTGGKYTVRPNKKIK